MKNTKVIKGLRIVLCSSLLFHSCDIKNKFDKKVVNCIAIFDLTNKSKDDIYLIKSYLLLGNGALYPFIANSKGNRVYNNDYHNVFFDKSPFDYESKDSIYDLFLTKTLSLRKKDTYIYTIGNNNFFEYNGKLVIAFNLKIRVNSYNSVTKETSTLNNDKVFVLDSLLEINRISESQMRKINLNPRNISNIDGFFPFNDIID